jgi:hypothetical protein
MLVVNNSTYIKQIIHMMITLQDSLFIDTVFKYCEIIHF